MIRRWVINLIVFNTSIYQYTSKLLRFLNSLGLYWSFLVKIPDIVSVLYVMKIYLSSFYWFWHLPSYTMSVNLTRSWLNLFVFTKRYLDQLRKSSFVSNSSKVLCTPRVCIGKMITDFIIETKEKQRRQNLYFLSSFLYIDWHKKLLQHRLFFWDT